MKSRMNTKRKIVIGITALAVIVFCVTLYRALFYAPTDEIAVPPPDIAINNINKLDPASYPVRLLIPKLNIDANVQNVGVTKAGNMATPNNFTDVGWYKYGPLPGEMGSSVLAGHVNNGLALPGVFADLEKIGVGDDVYVTTQGGTKLHFVVSKIETFDYNAKDTNVFTENDGKLLKLITCTGTWVSQIKTHNKRLVVTTVLSDK